MFGLIKKDLLMIKQNLKVFLIVFIVFLSMTIINESDMTFILPLMATMLSISTFSYDSFNKWDAYAITLPNGRRNIVTAKYISTLLIVLISFGVSITSLLIMSKCGVALNLSSSIAELIGCLAAVFIIISVMFPIIYKLGVEKGRIALFVLFFGVTGLAVLISQNMHISISSNIIGFLNNYYKIIIPIVACILMFVSYKFSERFYFKKEF